MNGEREKGGVEMKKGNKKDRTKLRTEHNLKERYEERTELKGNRCGQKRIEGEVMRTELK